MRVFLVWSLQPGLRLMYHTLQPPCTSVKRYRQFCCYMLLAVCSPHLTPLSQAIKRKATEGKIIHLQVSRHEEDTKLDKSPKTTSLMLFPHTIEDRKVPGHTFHTLQRASLQIRGAQAYETSCLGGYAGGLQVQGFLGLQSEFKTGLGNEPLMRPFL